MILMILMQMALSNITECLEKYGALLHTVVLNTG